MPFRPDSKDIDEEYLSTKLELEKMVNPELDLVGLYIRSQVA